jgi:hypothetical protein
VGIEQGNKMVVFALNYFWEALYMDEPMTMRGCVWKIRRQAGGRRRGDRLERHLEDGISRTC